ncbi:MAG: acyl carrier protein phosphodiesterase [Lentimonas sp.]|jgi:acyl carrier protein phosphodiesterase
MNFLGHLYFSGDNTELMTANLYGDFVKGSDISRFSPVVQKGITLHRSIDTYIDHHPGVIQLLHKLYATLPKVAGIAVDLYFDHLLAKRWTDFHQVPLAVYLQEYYDSIDFENQDYSKEFVFVLKKIVQHNWIYQYQFSHGLYKACQGVSRRISFKNELVNGFDVFEEFESEIESCFEGYMKDAKIKFLNTM